MTSNATLPRPLESYHVTVCVLQAIAREDDEETIEIATCSNSLKSVVGLNVLDEVTL